MDYNKGMLIRTAVFGYLEVECAPVRPIVPALLFSALLGLLVFGFTGTVLVFLPLTFRLKM